MTKRLTAIFLAVLAVLTLAACGQGETAPGTMGTMLAQVFEERGKADPNLDLTDLGNTLMNDSGLPIDGEVTPVEPGLLMGFGNDEITGFAEGVTLADGTALSPAEVTALTEDGLTVRVVLRQGVYHQIKRMFGVYGAGVNTLHRDAIGGLTLDPALAPGQWRELSDDEVAKISMQCTALFT